MNELRDITSRIDELAAKCELERYVAWEHPEPAEGPFEGGSWLVFPEDD